MSKITIYEVAEKAGVSLATVSRVLNNSPKVRPATKEKIEKVIKELGYQPNLIARGLASRKSNTIAVLVNDMAKSSIGELTNGIVDVAQLYGYTIKIISLNGELNIEEIYAKLQSEVVDGILRLDDNTSEDQFEFIKVFEERTGIKTLFVNTLINSTEIASISIDFEEASYNATIDLIKRGCKNIVISTSSRETQNRVATIKGYERAIDENKLKANTFFTTGKALEKQEVIADFVSNNKFDGLICSRDSIAVLFLNEFKRQGINVPEDVQVISYQNTKLAQMYYPSITCIQTPVYGIGAVGMRLLTKLIDNEKVDSMDYKLSHDLVYRETTKE